MDRFIQLGADIAELWQSYWLSYLTGIGNTLLLALVGTVIGCIIGLVCGILNTIPYEPTDALAKRVCCAWCAPWCASMWRCSAARP